MSCPLCKDCEWFSKEGWMEFTEIWHDEIVKEANEMAKFLVNEDEDKCSLSWNELWIHHFNKLYNKMFEYKKQKKIQDYINSVYENIYPKDEIKYICSYHEEFY